MRRPCLFSLRRRMLPPVLFICFRPGHLRPLHRPFKRHCQGQGGQRNRSGWRPAYEEWPVDVRLCANEMLTPIDAFLSCRLGVDSHEWVRPYVCAWPAAGPCNDFTQALILVRPPADPSPGPSDRPRPSAADSSTPPRIVPHSIPHPRAVPAPASSIPAVHHFSTRCPAMRRRR